MEKKTKKTKMPDGMREMSPYKASMFPVVGHKVVHGIPCTAQASSNPAVLKGPDNCDFPHLNHIRAAVWAMLQDHPKVLVCGYLVHPELEYGALKRLVDNPMLTPPEEEQLLRVTFVATDINYPTVKQSYTERMVSLNLACREASANDEDVMRPFSVVARHDFETEETLYSYMQEHFETSMVLHSAKGEFGEETVSFGELPFTTEFRVIDFTSNNDGRLLLAMRSQSGDKFHVPMAGALELSNRLLDAGGSAVIGRTAVVKHMGLDKDQGIPTHSLCALLK